MFQNISMSRLNSILNKMKYKKTLTAFLFFLLETAVRDFSLNRALNRTHNRIHNRIHNRTHKITLIRASIDAYSFAHV